MRTPFFLTLAAALTIPSTAVLAADKPSAEAIVVQGKSATGGGVGHAVEIQVIVTAVDKAKRTVTIKGPQGKTRVLAVGEDVRNFDQVKVGDTITIGYLEALVINLEKAKGATPGKVVTEDLKRAKPGEKPGGVATRQVTIVGTVTAIDEISQLVTVRGPEGNELDIKVQDPAKLKNVKTGDLVKATYTEALIIAVTAPKKSGTSTK
jgi:hypothetical protein